jgi:hypothetical protein
VDFFSKIQNGGFFEDDAIFEKKSTFFSTTFSTLNSTFFQYLKKQFCGTNTQKYTKKNCQTKFLKMAEICKMAFGLNF